MDEEFFLDLMASLNLDIDMEPGHVYNVPVETGMLIIRDGDNDGVLDMVEEVAFNGHVRQWFFEGGQLVEQGEDIWFGLLEELFDGHPYRNLQMDDDEGSNDSGWLAL
ncbi:MAG: hypothetical protein Q3972_06505 [Corynebacterium sp.]|nr:hypothetical protein [Corynebacterium sp.]